MLYHVSATPGIKVLEPRVSTHGKAYVYAIANLATGLLFGVHNDDFDFMINTDPETGFPTCFECYPGALEAVYAGKSNPSRTIKPMEEKYLQNSLDLVETVFAEYENAEEGKVVRSLVEEIRSKKYYVPELEFVMVDETDSPIGYVMFSRFHIEGRYEDELLILTPVAVKTELQRQHISKELIEYGLGEAKYRGYKAVMVEGNPKNYNPRGFKTSADYGIIAGESVHLPAPECLMVQELVPGALENMKGEVDYSFYESLR